MRHLRGRPTLVRFFSLCLIVSQVTRETLAVWYTSWQNRGYLSPTALSKMPLAHDRWRELSKQLLAFKTQEYEKAK